MSLVGVLQNITITASRSVTLDVEMCKQPSGTFKAEAIPVYPNPFSVGAGYGTLHYAGQTHSELTFNTGEQLNCVTTASQGTMTHYYLTPSPWVPLSTSLVGARLRVTIPFGASYDPEGSLYYRENPCDNPSLYQYYVTNQDGTNFQSVVAGEIRLAINAVVPTTTTVTDTSIEVCGLTVTQTRVTR